MGNRLYLRGFPTVDSHQYSFSFSDSEGHCGWSRTYRRGTILPCPTTRQSTTSQNILQERKHLMENQNYRQS